MNKGRIIYPDLLSTNKFNFEPIPVLKDLYKYPFQIILLYVFIFQPPFISRTTYFLIELIILLFFIITKTSNFWNTAKYFKIELRILAFILSYTIFRDLISIREVYILKILSFYIQSFIIPIFIVSIYTQNPTSNKRHTNLFSLIFWAAILASVFSFFLLTQTSFNHYYRSFIIIDAEEKIGNTILRGFGMSENLTFTYGYILGFISGYILLFMKSSYTHLIFIPFLLLGIIINARIGFFPIFLFLILTIFQKRGFINFFVISILFFLLAIIIPKIEYFSFLETNKAWVFAFFIDIYNSITGSDIAMRGGSTVSTLFNDFIIIPNTLIDLIFGTGRNLFFSQIEGNSDVGYITQFFYGGIIFLFLLFLFFIKTVNRLIYYYGFKSWFTIIFIFSIIILNTKGSIFVTTPGSRFLFLLYIYFIQLAINHKLKNHLKTI